MSSERFQRQDRGSFFGDMIDKRVVPADHFPRKLEKSWFHGTGLRAS